MNEHASPEIHSLCFPLPSNERKVCANLLQKETSFGFVFSLNGALNDCTHVQLTAAHLQKKKYEEPYNLKPVTTPREIMNPTDYQAMQGSPQLFLSLADCELVPDWRSQGVPLGSPRVLGVSVATGVL